jgi:SAM-dependent methyltransferase
MADERYQVNDRHKLPRRRLPMDRLVMAMFGPRGPLRKLSPVVAAALRRRTIAHWQYRWKIESERSAADRSDTAIPEELVEAVESGWFAPESSVFDIGSGRGQISAWLAERGFRVLGADLSDEATALAKLHFRAPSDRLEFRTLDVCTARPEPCRFDCLVDRGCFHVVPTLLLRQYVDNVACGAKDRARLLLFTRAGRCDAARELFAPQFEIVRVNPSVHVRTGGPLPPYRSSGLIFWMVRRPRFNERTT